MIEHSVKAKAMTVLVSKNWGRRPAGPSRCGGIAIASWLLTGEEKHQRPRIDNSLGQETGVVSICAPRHQVEIHGGEGLEGRGEEELPIA